MPYSTYWLVYIQSLLMRPVDQMESDNFYGIYVSFGLLLLSCTSVSTVFINSVLPQIQNSIASIILLNSYRVLQRSHEIPFKYLDWKVWSNSIKKERRKEFVLNSARLERRGRIEVETPMKQCKATRLRRRDWVEAKNFWVRLRRKSKRLILCSFKGVQV